MVPLQLPSFRLLGCPFFSSRSLGVPPSNACWIPETGAIPQVLSGDGGFFCSLMERSRMRPVASVTCFPKPLGFPRVVDGEALFRAVSGSLDYIALCARPRGRCRWFLLLPNPVFILAQTPGLVPGVSPSYPIS